MAMMQFSIIDLALGLGAISVGLAVGRWSMVLGIAAGATLLGVLSVRMGLRSRRNSGIVVGGLLVPIALGSTALPSLSVVTWVGRRTLNVHVMVVDASTLTPISNAKVEQLSGPDSLWEGIPSVAEFETIDSAASVPLTDKIGQTKFSHEFFAAGSYGMITESGYVATKNLWIRITCPGHTTTYLPVDHQSPRVRDIKDASPILVTVPLAKERATTEETDRQRGTE